MFPHYRESFISTLPPSGIHAIWRGLFLGVGTGRSNPRRDNFFFPIKEEQAGLTYLNLWLFVCPNTNTTNTEKQIYSQFL